MEERQKMVREKIEEEDFVQVMQLRGVKQIVYDKLIKEKGFHQEEIAIEPRFGLAFSNCEATVSMDFIISLHLTYFAVIRCANSGLEFWERYIIAFARAVKDYQIPFAMVTNGYEAKIINVLSGNSESKNMEDFYTREQAVIIMKELKKIPCPGKRFEREKR